MAVGGRRCVRLRRDDESPDGSACGARPRSAVLDTRRRAPTGGPRWDREDAVPDRGGPSGRGGLDALPRRAALGLPVVAVWLSADVHLLCDRPDALRPE